APVPLLDRLVDSLSGVIGNFDRFGDAADVRRQQWLLLRNGITVRSDRSYRARNEANLHLLVNVHAAPSSSHSYHTACACIYPNVRFACKCYAYARKLDSRMRAGRVATEARTGEDDENRTSHAGNTGSGSRKWAA